MASAAPSVGSVPEQAHQTEQENTDLLFEERKPYWSYGRRRYLRTAQYSAHLRYLRILMKKSQFTAVQSRNMKPGLSHQSQKTDRFEETVLPPVFGSSDDKKGQKYLQDGYRSEQLFLVDEWVAGLFEVDAAFIVKIGSLAFISMASAALAKIKSSCTMISRLREIGITFCCDLFAEVCKDDFNLFLFLKLQFTHVVVQFYNRHWFDKKCGTGGDWSWIIPGTCPYIRL